ncbi:MAG: flagellar biosynthesis anti-sigma factor FlgM [Terracidiphilus sp.]
MKVDLTSLVASQIPVDRGANKVSSGSVSGAQLSTEDRISFHSGTLSVQSLTSQAMSTPPIRQDKVDELSSSVANGTYKTDAGSIASGMIEHDQH